MATREDSEGGRATRNHLLCGCVTSCLGDSEHEPRITYCATHAAATELLAALRLAADAYANMCDEDAPESEGAAILRTIRAAIRKATEGA